jgi:hypothetical protein
MLKITVFFILITLKINLLNAITCNNLCSNNTKTFYNCFCTDCSIYNDCCENYQKQIDNSNLKRHECNIHVSENSYIYSTVKCASWYATNDLTKERCEKKPKNNFNSKNELILSLLPVYSSKTNSTFKNIYCAKCNIPDINLKELKYFDLYPSREFLAKHLDQNNHTQQHSYLLGKAIDEFIESSLNETKTKVYLKLKDFDLNVMRSCIKSIEICSSNSTNEEIKLCNNHTSYVYTKKLVYKNKYCAYCNGEIDKNIFCKPLLIRSPNLQILFDISKLFENITNQTCLDDSLINNIDDHIKKYLTITGNFVSIISLILLMIIYSSSSKLRNFPGKLLLCLSISLMFSQLFFTAGNYLTKPIVSSNDCVTLNVFNINDMLTSCYVLACFTHYFYLTFFAWTNVMAFDLYKMFIVLDSKKKSSSGTNDDMDAKKIRFFKYSVFAWLVPLLICLILIIKQFITNNLSYAYKSCFISDQKDLLIFFVIPVALILLFNVFFLTRSIISIRNVDKMTSKFLKKDKDSSITSGDISNTNYKKLKSNTSEKNRLILFLKLFILTGMTWIFG